MDEHGRGGRLRITRGICVEAGKDYLRRAGCELDEYTLGTLTGVTLEYTGDRKVWARILIVERLVRKDAGLVFAFSLSPAPQRAGNWKRLRMSDVHLRGEVVCVRTQWDQGRCVHGSGVLEEMFCIPSGRNASYIMLYNGFLI